MDKKQISAQAEIRFQVPAQAKSAAFLFTQRAEKVWLNGEPVAFKRQLAPGGHEWLLLIPLNEKGLQKEQQLKLLYPITGLTAWGLRWKKPFHWRTDFSDSSDARFSNVLIPSGFESERHPMVWNFTFRGLTQPLQVFSNATDYSERGKGLYRLGFDQRFNLAMPYFEFESAPLRSFNFAFQGLYSPIPVTLVIPKGLGKSQGLSEKQVFAEAEKRIRSTLFEFEHQYGPYAFPQLLVKLYSLQTGDLPLSQEYSMEYGGAIVSRLELIPHEICHMWFGRGASPQDAQAGFVDEVICDWYDYRTPFSNTQLKRPPSQLVPTQSWSLRTPEAVYAEGQFIAGLQGLFHHKQHNLFVSLGRFYRQYRLKSYAVADFRQFLEAEYGGDLTPFFSRFLEGQSEY
ncbi:MAG: hypothetical protein IV090_17530 [Candidatus Sericytochromatia bacterium]|nr:hypothetical protein [Candidatus Sericytochromatia bacterium]